MKPHCPAHWGAGTRGPRRSSCLPGALWTPTAAARGAARARRPWRTAGRARSASAATAAPAPRGRPGSAAGPRSARSAIAAAAPPRRARPPARRPRPARTPATRAESTTHPRALAPPPTGRPAPARRRAQPPPAPEKRHARVGRGGAGRTRGGGSDARHGAAPPLGRAGAARRGEGRGRPVRVLRHHAPLEALHEAGAHCGTTKRSSPADKARPPQTRGEKGARRAARGRACRERRKSWELGSCSCSCFSLPSCFCVARLDRYTRSAGGPPPWRLEVGNLNWDILRMESGKFCEALVHVSDGAPT